MAAFPEITRATLESARNYARQFSDEIDRCIRNHGAFEPPAEDEADNYDLAEFDRDLREINDRNAELFRRLAHLDP